MCDVYAGIIAGAQAGADAHLVHALGLPHPLVGYPGSDARPARAPALVHAAVDRMVDAWMTELDQFVEQNLLSLDANNTRIGSGGYG